MSYPNGDLTYYTVVAFEARAIGGALAPDGEEIASVRYFSKAECDQLSITRASRVIAARAFQRNGPPYFALATWSPAGC